MPPRPRTKSPAARILGTIVAVLIVAAVTVMQQKGLLPKSATNGTATGPGSQPTATSSPASEDASTSKSKLVSTPRGLRIGSWNIEWLGKPEDRSGPAQGVAQRTEDLADYIIAADVSILAVQEIIASVNSRPIRSHELEQTIDLIQSRTGDDWEYILFPGRQDGDQLTGILWNTAEVQALDSKRGEWDQLDAPWPLPIERGRSAQGSLLWNRPPHAMYFTAGDDLTDLGIIVLHMKADYQGDFESHRSEEAAALARAIPAAVSTFRDQDFILIGDANVTDPAESAIATFDKAGFRDTNITALQTHWRGGVMDKVFVPKGQREFAKAEFEVVSDQYLRTKRMSPQDFKTRLSDHYLVVMTMQVLPDDD